jgi:hypothetical protein
MQQYYRMYPEITSKLDNLTLLMIRKCATKPPKLRSRAGECMGLIYFGKLMAEEFLDPRNPYEQAIIIAGQELWGCYHQLSAAEYTAEALRTHGLQFRAQMAALDIHTRSVEFRVKPKMHLFLHVTSGKMGNPSSFWNYRGEDFGGSIADMFSGQEALAPRRLAVDLFWKNLWHSLACHGSASSEDSCVPRCFQWEKVVHSHCVH